MEIYTRYSQERPKPKTDFTIPTGEKSLKHPNRSQTKQSDKDRSDINQIVKKGILTTGITSSRTPKFGDFSNSADFLQQANRIAAFQAAFEELPAHIRNKFDNSPEEYLDYIQNPENKEEAIELGLLPKPVIRREKTFSDDGTAVVVTYKDDVEVARVDIPAPKAAEEAPPKS